jgi:hypothetical protein
MTDASPTPQNVDEPDAEAGAPDHHEHAIMNRRLDEDPV